MGGEGYGISEELSGVYSCLSARLYLSLTSVLEPLTSHFHDRMNISNEDYNFLDTLLPQSHALSRKCRKN